MPEMVESVNVASKGDINAEDGSHNEPDMHSPIKKKDSSIQFTRDGSLIINDESAERCVLFSESMMQTFLGKKATTYTDTTSLDTALPPPFDDLINFPQYLTKLNSQRRKKKGQSDGTNSTAKEHYCVMCGTLCILGGNAVSAKASPSSVSVDNASTAASSSSSPASSGTGAKITTTSAATPSTGSSQEQQKQQKYSTIPRQNKGLCNSCDVKVWLYQPRDNDASTASDLGRHGEKLVTEATPIKWCKGCKNFRLWPTAFGEKSKATKCTKCRERQMSQYASTKRRRKKIDVEKGGVHLLAAVASSHMVPYREGPSKKGM